MSIKIKGRFSVFSKEKEALEGRDGRRSGVGLNGSSFPVWASTGVPLDRAGTTVKYTPNNSADKAVVTT